MISFLSFRRRAAASEDGRRAVFLPSYFWGIEVEWICGPRDDDDGFLIFYFLTFTFLNILFSKEMTRPQSSIEMLDFR
ncbi:hypothetical protein BDV29DRAFT_109723 [Aspergillus leporis]|uniref:SEA domain-containing protein n=1 Tax=Aspergillus leporis TaxID=41062 RepID=A0A5N5X7M7_9EURO|nr:hypothetical protein BDV29DRAFT_109723 [Aspergillus leporis]